MVVAHRLGNGVQIINVTQHPVNFLVNGEIEVVAPSGLVCNVAQQDEETREGQLRFIRPTLQPIAETVSALAHVREQFPEAVIIGSVIAAQVYKGVVCAMVSAPGYERAVPAEKRMLPDTFQRF